MLRDQNLGGSPPRPMFDEKPIGQKKTFDIPEYAQNEDPNQIQENYNPQPRPLGERLKKKILKIKRQAVEQLLNLVKKDPKEFQQYESMTLELISFNDSMVQDRSLKVVILYLSAGFTLSVEPKSMIRTVIEKCLCIDKEEIKTNSEEILFWYMDNKHEDVLLSELNDDLLHKNKKIIAISLLFIANLLHNYGLKRLKGFQKFSKNLDLLSAPAKPTAKAQTITLFKQLYRWMGDSCLKEFKVHAEVKDEVMKFGSEYQKVPMEIKRGIKKQQIGNGQQLKPVYYQEDDESENKDPVDVLSYATPQWVDNLFKLEKWKQKKEVLDQFIKKIKVPCILPPRQVSHFIFLIKKLLSDNNVNICYCGFHVIQHMAKGLKKDFAHIARNIVSDLFGKLKELKAQTVDLAQKSIKSLLYALSLQDFMENIKDGLKDKSPVMKEQVLKLIQHFATKKDQKTVSILRSLTDKIVSLTEDSTPKVRNQAFEVLVTLKNVHSMKFFGDKLRTLDPKKLQALELAKPDNLPNEVEEVEQVTMVIQQAPPAPVINKESNTNRIKPAKSLDIEQKVLKSSRIVVKNDETSSVGSNGDYKVPRSLNLNYMDEISAPNEHVRTNAYQQIANKYLTKDIRQFLRQIKSSCLRQSNPTILKFVLQIAKKHINGGIGELQVAEFLAKHDWKRCKNILQQFLQTHKFTPQSDQILKAIGGLNNSNFKGHQNHSFPQNIISSGPSLRTFCTELQNTLISKMSSPIEEIKKEAAERALKIWEDIPKITSENELNPANGWQDDHITKFFNIIKYRLSDTPEIVYLYCQLLVQMLQKGISLKQKHMKSVVHSVFSNLSRGLSCIKQLFKQMVLNSPTQIFISMQSQIFAEATQPALIEFLNENSELFIKYADLKVFLSPFLHILCSNTVEMKHKQFLDNLFHQMVQILGEPVLEKQISKIKVPNPEIYNQYLQKYNMSLNKTAQSQSTSRNYRLKDDRLKYWEEEGWQLEITSNHILKLANIMINLGEPISSLCNFFYLTPQNMKDLHSFDYASLADFSDVFFKFIYWRVAIDGKQTVDNLFNFTSRLIIATNCLITEVDVIILMRTFIFIMERFQGEFQHQICDLLKKLFSINAEIQDNTLQFWINYLMNHSPSQTLNGCILSLMIKCYDNKLNDNLVALARIPAVHKNEKFFNFLTKNCDHQHLKASGFRISAPTSQSKSKKGQQKILLTDLGGPENMIPIEPSEMMALKQMFLQNSQYLLARLSQLSSLDPYSRVEKYVKTLYSILTPFFSGQIPFINVFEFIKELVKITAEPYEHKKTYLRELTRMLLFMLIDLDEKPPNGSSCQQMTKQVNKCILNILETSKAKHMLEILYLLAKTHIQLNLSPKVIQIILKCITKILRYNDFAFDIHENIRYVFEQNNQIFQQFNISLEAPLMKTLKSTYTELYKLYQTVAFMIVEQMIRTGCHPHVLSIYEEFRSTSQEPQSLPLAEQTRQVNNIANSLNAIRTMGPVSMKKLTTVKKARNQGLQ